MIKKLTCASDAGCLKINNCLYSNNYGDTYNLYVEIITGEDAKVTGGRKYGKKGIKLYENICSFHLKKAEDKIEIYQYDCGDKVIFRINGIDGKEIYYDLFRIPKDDGPDEFKLVEGIRD